MTKFNFFVGLTFCIFSNSCIKKDAKVEPEPVASTPPVIAFNFQSKVKGDNLIADSKFYINASHDSFTVTKFNYFFSNIRLTRDDGFVLFGTRELSFNKTCRPAKHLSTWPAFPKEIIQKLNF